MTQTYSLSTDKYWATEFEAENVIGKLKEMRREFIAAVQDTELFMRIKRSHKYYYGMYYSNQSFTDKEIKFGGNEGDVDMLAMNEYRAVVSMLKTYITTVKADWDTLARDGASNALEATKLGNELLDSYMADNKYSLETRFRQSAEDGLVYSAGFIWNKWNDSFGKEVDVDPMTGKIVHSGDIEFLTPLLFDVVWDLSATDFRDSKWACVRNRENKWDIIEQYAAPEGSEEGKPSKSTLLGACGQTDDIDERLLSSFLVRRPKLQDDFCWVYYWYHRPCPSLPMGRFIKFVGNVVLEEDELVDGHIPIHRFVPANYRNTSFGYSIAFDLQGPQEALNMISSTILNNQDKLGPTKIWFKTGEPINQADLEPGITVIQTETEPKPLNFLQTPRELFTALDTYRGVIERLSGVNATSRGNPEYRLAGKAYELLEDRTRQSASDILSNYFTLMTDVGNSILQIHKNRTKQGFTFRTAVQKGPKLFRQMTPEILDALDSVSVIVGNPLMGSWGSRVQTLNYLLGTGMIKTPEDFLTVLETGKLDVLLETNDKQLNVIHAENDEMLAGKDVDIVSITDNHVLHVKKHQAALDNPEIRRNVPLAQKVLAHILKHFDFLKDPFVQELMMILGYEIPVPPKTPQAMPGVPGGPPSPPGGPAMLPGEGRGGPQPKGPPGVSPPVPQVPGEPAPQ